MGTKSQVWKIDTGRGTKSLSRENGLGENYDQAKLASDHFCTTKKARYIVLILKGEEVFQLCGLQNYFIY